MCAAAYAVLAAALLAGAAGCGSPKERLPALPPRLMLDASALSDHPLGPDSAYQLLTLQETPHSSLHIFRLKVGGELPPRYHKKRDLVVSCMEGGAIVLIEDDRYPLEPGRTVLIPHYRTYSLLQHGSDKDFVASFAFAPAYDPADVYIVKTQRTPGKSKPPAGGAPPAAAEGEVGQ